MTIVAPYFNRIPQYEILLHVFNNSAKEKMPDSKIEIINFKPPCDKYGKGKELDHNWDTYYAFMAKISRAIEIQDNVLMTDSDLIFLKSVDDIWKRDFDIAITIRDHRCKYNTGLCAIKPTIEAKYFLKRWKENTREVAEKQNWNKIYEWWGIDQYALHLTIQEKIKIKLMELPCHIWNSTQNDWKNITNDTRVVHIKSGLRRIVFGTEKISPKHYYLRPILERIKKYENPKERIAFY